MKEQKENKQDINYVDYFNLYKADEGLKLLESRKSVKKISIGKYGDATNKATENDIAYEFKNGYLEVHINNSLGLIKGYKYSPFQLLMKLKFKDNFHAACAWVGITYMDYEFPYVRVGCGYYKIIKYNDTRGIERTRLDVWQKAEIKQDYTPEMIKKVQVYDTFVMEPDNLNYQSVIDNNYNRYAKFPHVRKKFTDPKQIKWSLKLMKHIFGDQMKLGLRYMKILYTHPKQILPILVLISEDRATGKTTFLDWLGMIFGDNMSVISPNDLGNAHNGSYAFKNIVGIEESKFDSKSLLDKLKALSTQKDLTVNPKNIQQYQVPFYGKLIITSNDENKFSIVDRKEIRYWVRKVPKLKDSNHNILDDLKSEIPYFLDFLYNEVPDVDFSKSRQVFTPEEINTKELTHVKEESKSALLKELEYNFDEWGLKNQSKESFEFTLGDIKTLWYSRDNNMKIGYIRSVLTEEFMVEEATLGQYHNFSDVNYPQSRTRGRFYTVKNEHFVPSTNGEATQTELKELKIDEDDYEGHFLGLD